MGVERDGKQDETEADDIGGGGGGDDADKLEGKLSEAIAGDANVLKWEGTKIALLVLGVCTEAGNCGSSEAATDGLETGRDKQDVPVCEGAGRDEITD